MPVRLVNETIFRFGYPDTLVAEYEYWVVLLRPTQPTLGSLVLAAKGAATRFSELPPEAFSELHVIVGAIEATLTIAVEHRRLNYLMLMMVDPNVHFHVIPRYEGERSSYGVTIRDSAWPQAPGLGEAVVLKPADVILLTSWLRRIWSRTV